MIIKFLGTGTSQGIPVVGCECSTCISQNSHDKRLRSSVFIEVDNLKILIDTGPDLRQQLLTNNISDVDAILITHEHNDHTAGLDDIRPINFKHNKTLPLYSIYRVLEDIKQRFKYVFSSNPYPGSPKIILNEIIPFMPFLIGKTEVIPLEYDHGTIKIIGFRIKKFAYLTDASFLDDKVISYLQDLDVLVISALQRSSHHSHLSFDEAKHFSQLIKANKTYFIHMSHTLGPTEEWSKELPENIHGSYDGLTLEIK